ncbi:hypothetical protein OHA25_12640 [Nonomuraea sp. NBC_00507]|uniref:hypothetical protein n=1 Tax=Nonomuraea sp. NBC_00507 TaxID=2976002 RepID=UPI002E17656D
MPFLIENVNPKLATPHEFLADLRAFMTRRKGGSILLGERARADARPLAAALRERPPAAEGLPVGDVPA